MDATRLRCPCGDLIVGETENHLVELSLAHLAEKHPRLANTYGRDEILFMAF